MNHEELYLCYNLDFLLNIYNELKDKSSYSGYLDEETKSQDFVNIILDNLYFYDTNNDEDDIVLDEDNILE